MALIIYAGFERLRAQTWRQKMEHEYASGAGLCQTRINSVAVIKLTTTCGRMLIICVSICAAH